MNDSAAQEQPIPLPGTARLRLPRKTLLFGSLFPACVGALASGNRWWSRSRFTQGTADAYLGGDITLIAPTVAGFIDPLGFFDPNLGVYGLEALRIVDASAMPKIVRGKTNAPALRIGERAAALIGVKRS